MVNNINRAYAREKSIIVNNELRARVQVLEYGVLLVQAPAQILERKMHLLTAYIVIPIFSLANAGIPIDWDAFGEVIFHPVSVGVSLGLVVGETCWYCWLFMVGSKA